MLVILYIFCIVASLALFLALASVGKRADAIRLDERLKGLSDDGPDDPIDEL